MALFVLGLFTGTIIFLALDSYVKNRTEEREARQKYFEEVQKRS